jgi:hypothetical protein
MGIHHAMTHHAITQTATQYATEPSAELRTTRNMTRESVRDFAARVIRALTFWVPGDCKLISS